MRIPEYLQAPWEALCSNPMRSLLTTLGVVIGVAAVVTVSLILQGLTVAVTRSFEGMGPRALFVTPFQTPEHRNRRVELTYQDALAIEQECDGIAFTSPQVSLTATLLLDGRSRRVNLIGAIPDYQEMNQVFVDEGRFFSAIDSQHRRNVCVIGPTVREAMKHVGSPIGTTIRLDDRYFTVIGILEARGQLMGTDQDNIALIPLPTVGKLYGAQLPRRLTVMAQAKTIETVDRAIQQISAVLRKRHRLGDLPPDFKIFTQTEILENVRQFSSMITGVAAGLVSIALFVGGIGIMNTMLATVTERAYEIGLRKAVGARRGDILRQFLIEAVALSAGGAVVGLIVGCAAGIGFGMITTLPVSLSIWPLMLAFSFACVVGLFFGVYPASRAASLDPIQALQRV